MPSDLSWFLLIEEMFSPEFAYDLFYPPAGPGLEELSQLF